MRINNFFKSRLLFSSPWLLTAAASLLIMIIVTFAFHNLQHEKSLMNTAMLQRSNTLAKAVYSGARASYLIDLKRNFWDSDPWQVYIQRTINHLVDDKEIKNIILIDEDGLIIAHNKTDLVGVRQSINLSQMSRAGSYFAPDSLTSILLDNEGIKVFRVIYPFKPFLPFNPSIMLGKTDSKKHKKRFFMAEGFFLRPDMLPPPNFGELTKRFFIIVDLDMSQFDKTLSRLRFQIVMLSVTMLLVGLAGWLSLSVVQGYRVSQKTLDEIQAFTSLLIASLPIGVIATTRREKITNWNQAVSDITGIPKKQAIGKTPHAILPQEISVFFSDKTPPAISKEPNEKEIRLYFKEEEYVLLCRLITIFDTQQRYMGKMLLLSDISNVKLLEERMRESERLAAIGKMAGGVAHEVRNPLSSIKGLSLILKNTFAPASKEYETADLLIQETERMNRTITEMLTFTRPISLKRKSFNLGALLEKELKLLKPELDENNIQPSLSLPEDTVLIDADQDRITQVVMNILLNSVQAMEETGGTLTVSVKNRAHDQSVEISVTDTGKGMDKETMSQAFYPYFTTRKKGTGIGLAISQKIISEHEGTLTIESGLGKGTVVTLRLPERTKA